MGYSAYLTPRKEIISDEGVEGIIELANLSSGDLRNIEANPDLFFELTHPKLSDFKNALGDKNLILNTLGNFGEL